MSELPVDLGFNENLPDLMPEVLRDAPKRVRRTFEMCGDGDVKFDIMFAKQTLKEFNVPDEWRKRIEHQLLLWELKV